MKKLLLVLALAVVLVLISALAVLSPVSARPQNQNKLLNGSYSLVLHGFAAPNLSAVPTEPFGCSGFVQFDGSGNITALSLVVNQAGVVATSVGGGGTYSVAADGTGTMKLTFVMGPGIQSFEFAIAVAQNGDHIFLNLTSDERLEGGIGAFFRATVTGEAERQ